MKKSLFVSLAAALTLCTVDVQQATAQNSSPYWSVYGNSNATTYQKVGTTNAYPLRLITNNSTRIYIGATNGYVGIGTTSPSARLHVNAASGTSPLKVAINGSYKLYVGSNGYVGINTSSPAYNLQVNGNASVSSGLYVGNNGVYGYNSGGPGVYGSGSTNGVEGHQSSSGNGVYGESSTGNGVYGYSSSGYALYGVNSNSSWGSVAYGGYGGAYGYGATYGVYGSSSGGSGVYAYSSTGYALEAHNNSGNWAATAYGGYGGVYGTGGTYGLYGVTSGGTGVYGYSSTGLGGYFYSASSYGIRAATGRSDKNWAGVFDGNVYAFGAYQTSDRNLKKNIEDFSDAMSIINKLKPKSYEFRTDGKLSAMNLPQGKHYGLIAQDLEQLLPNLVKEVDGAILPNSSTNNEPKPTSTTALNSKMPGTPTIKIPGQQSTDQNATAEKMTIKSVNYIELIPIIVKGMQEQSDLIKQQQQQINDLKDQISRLTGNSNILTSAGTLGQNSPNPVRTTTRIAYSVPNNGRAQLLLTDALGKTIKVLSLNNSGYVNFNAAGLSSGMYNYSLMVDGKIVETKKMEIVR